MKKIEMLDNCTQCGACVDICPVDAIKLTKRLDYSENAVINIDKCINCSACERVCPIIHTDDNVSEVEVGYIGYTREKNILKNSSSGGIFACLATSLIKNGGSVCGAVYDDNYSVRHIVTNSLEDVIRMQGSKYSQSRMSGCYRTIKSELLEGRRVLFSGTPCEVAGLKHYLGKEYDSLITVGFICHGVPKSDYLPEYIKGLERRYKGKVASFSLRDKTLGWTDFCVRADFENGKHYSRRFTEDSYMRAFLQDYSLKESCYSCKFKCNAPKCDLILADFWGAELYRRSKEELAGGISAILVYSEKGKSILNQLQRNSSVFLEEFDSDKLLQYNQHYFKSAVRLDKVDRFNDAVGSIGTYHAIEELCSIKKSDLIRRRLKKSMIKVWGLLWKNN